MQNVPGGSPAGLMQNITLVNGASISVTPSTLNFSTQAGTPSPVQSYTVNAAGLTTDITITAPASFEISLSATGTFSNVLTIQLDSANYKAQNIYVRYNPATSGNTSAIINHTSGTISQNVSATGSSASITSIYEIQGAGLVSPFKGQTVVTEGIVTGDFQGSTKLRGFYIQDQNGDNNSETSDGIFVFEGTSSTDVKIGDKIKIQASVEEFNGLTELKNITSLLITGSGFSIAPTIIDQIPSTSTSLEKYENMYVTITPNLTVIENFNLGRFGELSLSFAGRQFSPTNYIDPNDNPASGTNSTGNSNVNTIKSQMANDSIARLLLNDGSSVQNPAIVPFLDPSNNTLRIGTTIASVKLSII